MTDRRRLRLQTLQRAWTWHLRGGQPIYGPIIELELGYRVALALLNPTNDAPWWYAA